jgi:E3 ubiquitin-protein ligase RFWD3
MIAAIEKCPMIASPAISTCSLCGEPLMSTGDHQICSLSCGHIFGFSCINRWFELNCQCPACRKRIESRDIQLLFWSTAVTTANDEIVRLEESNTRLSRDNRNLEIEIRQLQSKLQVAKDQLAHDRVPLPHAKPAETVAAVARPSVICERRISDGFRICPVEQTLVLSAKIQNEFGFHVIPIHSLTDVSTVCVHAHQIRDIAEIGHDSLIVSASLDRTLSVTSMETLTVLSRYSFDIPLWCCCPAVNNIIVTAGDQGKLFCIDLRCEDSISKLQWPGPPINSLAVLNDNLVMALTARDSNVFDLRSGRPQTIPTDVRGGICIRRCPETPFFTVLTRRDQTGEANFCTFEQGGKFSSFSSTSIAYPTLMSRAAMRTVNGVVYAAIPNEASNDFSVFAMSQPKNDIWTKWRPRWGVPRNPSPVIDLAITSDTESVLIASVTTDRYCVYETPIR